MNVIVTQAHNMHEFLQLRMCIWKYRMKVRRQGKITNNGHHGSYGNDWHIVVYLKL